MNLLEVFRRKKRLFLVFEFVDRTVLDDLEKYPEGLQDENVKSISFQVLRGLEFCHSHNVRTFVCLFVCFYVYFAEADLHCIYGKTVPSKCRMVKLSCSLEQNMFVAKDWLCNLTSINYVQNVETKGFDI